MIAMRPFDLMHVPRRGYTTVYSFYPTATDVHILVTQTHIYAGHRTLSALMSLAASIDQRHYHHGGGFMRTIQPATDVPKADQSRPHPPAGPLSS